ncbi:hypothetical protein [Variovorax sp. H27-G14]|uniref:hypothetical protein n=1 Tax=Variovorax sp. H27-G14 TaxID=3111914 RepID=UPI0038FCF572
MNKLFFCAFSAFCMLAPAASAFAQIGSPVPPGGLAPGLYVSVTDGQIVLANKGGSTNFAAGQFGFVASPTQPPVLIPKNPAVQFTPPPSFSSSTTAQTSSTPPKSGGVDCVVR